MRKIHAFLHTMFYCKAVKNTHKALGGKSLALALLFALLTVAVAASAQVPQLIKDINLGTSRSLPQELTNVNGTLFFFADDGTHGSELWKSDGTAAGTFMIKDINPGSDDALLCCDPTLTNINGTLFFIADDGTHGR